MGSRANVVTIEKGETKIYFFRWLAQKMDTFAILGEENFRRFLDESYENDDDQVLMDNAWAEGGLLLDFDNKVLIWFGGEDIEDDRPYLDAYMLLLRRAWPGWDVRWADMGNYDIGLYMGLSDDELREIVGTHKKGDRPLEDVVRMRPDERTGLITISGERGCFTMSTSCWSVSELLDFGKGLASLYPSMTHCDTALIDMRPNAYLRHDIEWAADPERAERAWSSTKDKPWANPACGYAEPGNEFPEYGIYIDTDSKYLEYWTTCGYHSSPVADETFPDDWTVVDKGADYASHFALAGPSIKVEPCDPSAYFPVVEGWTLRIGSRSSINALELDNTQMQSYFDRLIDGYAASAPKGHLAQIEAGEGGSPFRPDVDELPDPKPYDGPHFNVLDYASPRYAEAKTIKEAIEMRGANAFFERVSADDFIQDSHGTEMLLGFADLWAQSTWNKSMPGMRDVEQERAANSLSKGDFIHVRRCPSDVSDWEKAFYTMDGRLLPYRPYHDYDDVALNRWLDELRPGETLLCQVEEVTCYGEDGVQQDPDFCWRVYSCSTRVFKVTQPFSFV